MDSTLSYPPLPGRKSWVKRPVGASNGVGSPTPVAPPGTGFAPRGGRNGNPEPGPALILGRLSPRGVFPGPVTGPWQPLPSRPHSVRAIPPPGSAPDLTRLDPEPPPRGKERTAGETGIAQACGTNLIWNSPSWMGSQFFPLQRPALHASGGSRSRMEAPPHSLCGVPPLDIRGPCPTLGSILPHSILETSGSSPASQERPAGPGSGSVVPIIRDRRISGFAGSSSGYRAGEPEPGRARFMPGKDRTRRAARECGSLRSPTEGNGPAPRTKSHRPVACTRRFDRPVGLPRYPAAPKPCESA